VLPTLAGFYWFWRDEFPGLAERISIPYLMLVPILALGVDRSDPCSRLRAP
jgi:hypothetical protein